jgi:NitT/TauT family transport system substrate-binding protein
MRKILAAAVLAAISASLIWAAPAQAQTPIKIMVGGIDKQIYLPAKLAAQLGFFKEQGLDVELFNSTSGSQAATALLAREVQGVVGFYDHTIDLQSKGKFITSVVQFAVAPGEVVLVKAADADKLKDPANWKGQALGVTGLGSATDFLTRALAAKAGLKVNLPKGSAADVIVRQQLGQKLVQARCLPNGSPRLGGGVQPLLDRGVALVVAVRIESTGDGVQDALGLPSRRQLRLKRFGIRDHAVAADCAENAKVHSRLAVAIHRR